tara:strand:+ start:803 stop:1036 length:234 start_codon:yes stop_codon:yes gene_type:complete
MPTRIREIRKRRKMTLKELSASSGITIAKLSNIERGHHLPNILTLTKLAVALNTIIGRIWRFDPEDIKKHKKFYKRG